MKYIILSLIICFNSAVFGQKIGKRSYNKTQTVTIGDGVTVTYKDKNGKLKTDYYGVAGIKKEPIDSTKIYWKRYIKLRNKGIPDSLNPYTSKLKK